MIAMTGHPSPAPSPSRGEGFLFALAGWAVERAALARQAADGATAPGRARQPGFVVHLMPLPIVPLRPIRRQDRKSTRLNSSHANISYAVFCLKKKNKKIQITY